MYLVKLKTLKLLSQWPPLINNLASCVKMKILLLISKFGSKGPAIDFLVLLKKYGFLCKKMLSYKKIRENLLYFSLNNDGSFSNENKLPRDFS